MMLQVEQSGKITIVALPPITRITASPPIEEIREGLEKILASDTTKALIIDLKNVEYGGTRLLSTLVMIHIRAKKLGKRLKICNASEFVADGLSQTHLDQILEVYDTLEEALVRFIV